MASSELCVPRAPDVINGNSLENLLLHSLEDSMEDIELDPVEDTV